MSVKCYICGKEIIDEKFVYEKYNDQTVEICDHHPRPKKENNE